MLNALSLSTRIHQSKNPNELSVEVFNALAPIVSYSSNKDKYIVYKESQNKQGKYFLYDTKNKKYPLIVMPHGGPINVRDTRYYNDRTQFLTSNGLAVLRVNFRGSNGQSKELKEAGKL